MSHRAGPAPGNTGLLNSEPGTYVLILHSETATRVRVGRWGELEVRPGYYLYVGSAFGPGGLRSRVSRHARKGKVKHWHVDYLREVTELTTIWYSYESKHLEHEWAQALAGLPGIEPVKGFGCSDCTCDAHLFFARRKPHLKEFACNSQDQSHVIQSEEIRCG